MFRQVRLIALLAVVTFFAAISQASAAPVVLTVEGMAQFDPPPLPLGGSTTPPFGIVSGQPMTLQVGYDDAIFGNGTHRASSATGITITFTLGAPGQQVQFTETDDACFDDPTPFCDGFPSITLFGGALMDIDYFGSIEVGAVTYNLAAANDLAESPTLPGFYFDWLLYNATNTQTLAGGTLQISEPGTFLLFASGLIALRRSRRFRRAQA
tara:strand:- start:450 stop:1082 length:633 start_codon:yes stop_codon:yes gene_type:complete